MQLYVMNIMKYHEMERSLLVCIWDGMAMNTQAHTYTHLDTYYLPAARADTEASVSHKHTDIHAHTHL